MKSKFSSIIIDKFSTKPVCVGLTQACPSKYYPPINVALVSPETTHVPDHTDRIEYILVNISIHSYI